MDWRTQRVMTGLRRASPVVMAVAVVPLLMTVPTGVRATALGNVFAYDSADDYIGQGLSATWTDVNASFGVFQASPGSITLWVGTNDATNWHLEFDAPAGQTLHEGVYLDASSSPDLGRPAISIRGDGRACNTTSGRFAIEDLVTDADGVPTAAAVSFEQGCDSSLGLLVGRVRVGSSTAMAGLSMPHPTPLFPNTRVGDTSAPVTFAFHADGDVPVRVGVLAVTGPEATDFTVSGDGCSNTILAPGDACTYAVTSTPSAAGRRSATITIPSDMLLSPRRITVLGVGLIRTSTSVSVAPDTTWNNPGLLYTVNVTPNPGGGLFACVVDGKVLREGTLGPDGRGLCVAPRTLGTHTVRGQYEENSAYASSVSEVITYTASATTFIDLRVVPGAGGSVDVTASVSTASGLLYPGGTLTVSDETTSSVIGTLAVDATTTTLEIAPVLTGGSHHLAATYGGVIGVLDPSSASTDVVVDAAAPSVPGQPTGVRGVAGDASAAVSWSAPVDDGGSPITGFTVISSPGDMTCSTAGALGCVVSGLTNGMPYTFTVTASNGIGLGPASAASLPVTPAAPKVVLPLATISALPSLLATNLVPVRWGATPGTVVVASYDVRYRRAAWNGSFGPYAIWLSATARTVGTFSGLPGSTYCFAVRARDARDAVSAWTAETCTAVPLDDRSVSRVGSWSAGTMVSYYRSTFVRSYTYGSRLVRTGVVARQIALLATTCRACGSVRVYWGSTLVRTLSLYSSTTRYRRLITITTFTSARSGTLTIKVSSFGRPVIIDGVAIRRN